MIKFVFEDDIIGIKCRFCRKQINVSGLTKVQTSVYLALGGAINKVITKKNFHLLSGAHEICPACLFGIKE